MRKLIHLLRKNWKRIWNYKERKIPYFYDFEKKNNINKQEGDTDDLQLWDDKNFGIFGKIMQRIQKTLDFIDSHPHYVGIILSPWPKFLIWPPHPHYVGIIPCRTASTHFRCSYPHIVGIIPVRYQLPDSNLDSSPHSGDNPEGRITKSWPSISSPHSGDYPKYHYEPADDSSSSPHSGDYPGRPSKCNTIVVLIPT